MNILITTGIFPPDVGGPANFVPLIADNLSKNHVLNVITLSEELNNIDEFDYGILRIRRKQNKLYRQFKMYNDPSLNPKIYQKK